MHADRVLGDVSWTRGQRQKHECRPQQADVHGLELPLERAAWRNGGVVLLLPSHRTRSPRALTPRKVDDRPQPTSLTVQHTNPGLARSPDKAQVEVPSSAGGSITVSSRWCAQGPSEAPASPLLPSRLEARLPLRPLFLRAGRLSHCPKKADSTCRPPLLRSLASQSWLPSLSRQNPRRAGSLSKAHCRFSTLNLSFARFESRARFESDYFHTLNPIFFPPVSSLVFSLRDTSPPLSLGEADKLRPFASLPPFLPPPLNRLGGAYRP